MTPTERGCAEEKASAGEIAAGIAIIPLLVGALVITEAHLPYIPTGPEECADYCYTGLVSGEDLTATLLIPPWFREERENCGISFFTILPPRYRCILKLSIDGLSVPTNERSLTLSTGRRAVVLTVSANTDVWGTMFECTDGLYLEAKEDRVYALCVSIDDKLPVLTIWIVDNETGQVVAGQKGDFDGEGVSSYSRFCPIN